MNELGELLRKLRGKRSLRDVGKLTELSHTYISDLEKGFNHNTKAPINPSPDTLKRLSGAYDYPYSELLKVAGYIEETNEGDIAENDLDEEYRKIERFARKVSSKEREKALNLLKLAFEDAFDEEEDDDDDL